MAETFDRLPIPEALALIGKDFHRRGWMAGTAGNLSARAADGETFWITGSRHHKGFLEKGDFLRMRVADSVVIEHGTEGNVPSAEASIHRAIYELFPTAQACFHVHSVEATLVTAGCVREDEIALPALEMLKGLGVWELEPRVGLPLFDNHHYVLEIAEAIRWRFSTRPPRVPALLIRDHGTTAWGASLQQAYNHIEIIEFILSYMARPC
jgi:methylthioribulose-1-phosphate dehydratase